MKVGKDSDPIYIFEMKTPSWIQNYLTKRKWREDSGCERQTRDQILEQPLLISRNFLELWRKYLAGVRILKPEKKYWTLRRKFRKFLSEPHFQYWIFLVE